MLLCLWLSFAMKNLKSIDISGSLTRARAHLASGPSMDPVTKHWKQPMEPVSLEASFPLAKSRVSASQRHWLSSSKENSLPSGRCQAPPSEWLQILNLWWTNFRLINPLQTSQQNLVSLIFLVFQLCKSWMKVVKFWRNLWRILAISREKHLGY